MIGTQIALIRRELLEHRSLYIVPALLGSIVALVFLTGEQSVDYIDGQHIDAALLGASNIGVHERGGMIAVIMGAISVFFIVTMWIQIIFYSLSSLYTERKDKSILFWRSLPVTDAETVVSKVLTAIVAIPLITIAFIAVTHILALMITSVWVGSRGADAWHLIWEAAPLLDVWGVVLMFMLGITIWLSPYVGWFLLVSSYVTRTPMLFAFLPVIVLPLLERLFFNSSTLAEQLLGRVGQIVAYIVGLTDEVRHYVETPDASLVGMVDVGNFLSNSGMWGGLVVCGLFITAAMFVRRYRGEA